MFSRILTEYGEILRICPYSVQMRENMNQNNPEYGHFLLSVNLKEICAEMLICRAFPKMKVLTKLNGSLNYRSYKVAPTLNFQNISNVLLNFPENVKTISIVLYGNA